MEFEKTGLPDTPAMRQAHDIVLDSLQRFHNPAAFKGRSLEETYLEVAARPALIILELFPDIDEAVPLAALLSVHLALEGDIAGPSTQRARDIYEEISKTESLVTFADPYLSSVQNISPEAKMVLGAMRIAALEDSMKTETNSMRFLTEIIFQEVELKKGLNLGTPYGLRAWHEATIEAANDYVAVMASREKGEVLTRQIKPKPFFGH